MLLVAASCATKRRALDTGLPGVTTHADPHTPNMPAIGLAFFSGACWGVHQTVVRRTERLPGGWSRNWWEPSQSWRNRYAGGDPRNGPRFPGSTGVLGWTTEAQTLFGTGHRAALFASGLTITLGQRKPVWHYAVDVALNGVAFSLGYHTLYSSNLIFRDR